MPGLELGILGAIAQRAGDPSIAGSSAAMTQSCSVKIVAL
jgi:hypothetical protein